MHPFSSWTRSTAFVLVSLLTPALLAQPVVGPPTQICLYPVGATNWSDTATWGGPVPGPGQNATILPGQIVILDQDTAALGTLTIQGWLIFADRPLTLAADQIVIDGGHLDVGGYCGPFKSTATILIGTPPCSGPAATNYGIVIRDGGILELRGRDVGKSWSRLATTAPAGATQITLQDAVNWRAGDQIVLASTDFDMELYELNVVQSVSGSVVQLTSALAHEHFAGDVGTPPHTVPEYGEVGLLSRNVVVAGQPTDCDANPATPPEYGGHVRFERTSCIVPTPVALLDGVEFRGLGNSGNLAEYPVHFHHLGDLSASHVVDCSINQSWNKGLVVHNGQNLLATGNVAFDTYSYAYYMEESCGVPGECQPCGTNRVVGCTFDNNLGLVTRATSVADALHEHDQTPGTFYTRNWDNVVTNNAAAGSEFYGFYHRMPNEDMPSGAVLTHDGNVAHSNGKSGWYHDDRPRVDIDPLATPPYVRGLTAWKNREYGVYLRVYSAISMTGARIADNRTGLYLASAGTLTTPPEGTLQYITDMVIVGESPQNDDSEPGANWTALEQAHNRSLPVDIPWAVDPRNLVRNIDMPAPGVGVGVERPLLMRDFYPDQNGLASTVLFDVEGDMVSWLAANATVPPGVPSGVPTYFFPNNPLLSTMPGVVTPPVFDADVNGWLWTPDMTTDSTECLAHLEIVDCSPVSCQEPTHVDFWHYDYTNSLTVPVSSFRCFDPKQSSIDAFMANIPVGHDPGSYFLNNVFLMTWDRVTTKVGTDCLTTNTAPGCTGTALDIPEELTVTLYGGRTAGGIPSGSVVYFGVPLSGPSGDSHGGQGRHRGRPPVDDPDGFSAGHQRPLVLVGQHRVASRPPGRLHHRRALRQVRQRPGPARRRRGRGAGRPDARLVL